MVTDVLRGYGIRAGAMAPYSSGLYASAYAGGVFDFEAGLVLMLEAYRCIRNQNNMGGMGTVLGLSADQIEQLCTESEEAVEVSIINTRYQIVVSGENSALDKLLVRALSIGAQKASRLPAGAPYHSSLLTDADNELAHIVAETAIDDPHTPIVSYIDGTLLTNRSQVKSMLTQQLSNQVKWVNVVEELIRGNHMPMVEIGPGQMLYRSVRWINRRTRVFHTGTVEELEKTIKELR
jgi:malonyl CoA-acyl carrier protein transacylase